LLIRICAGFRLRNQDNPITGSFWATDDIDVDGAVGAGNADASSSNFFWGQNWLDLGKIKAKFEQN